MRTGTVYSETTLHAAAERFAAEVPFQIALIDLDGGGRLTARIVGKPVAIGDRVVETEGPDAAPRFQAA